MRPAPDASTRSSARLQQLHVGRLVRQRRPAGRCAGPRRRRPPSPPATGRARPPASGTPRSTPRPRGAPGARAPPMAPRAHAVPAVRKAAADADAAPRERADRVVAAPVLRGDPGVRRRLHRPAQLVEQGDRRRLHVGQRLRAHLLPLAGVGVRRVHPPRPRLRRGGGERQREQRRHRQRRAEEDRREAHARRRHAAARRTSRICRSASATNARPTTPSGIPSARSNAVSRRFCSAGMRSSASSANRRGAGGRTMRWMENARNPPPRRSGIHRSVSRSTARRGMTRSMRTSRTALAAKSAGAQASARSSTERRHAARTPAIRRSVGACSGRPASGGEWAMVFIRRPASVCQQRFDQRDEERGGQHPAAQRDARLRRADGARGDGGGPRPRSTARRRDPAAAGPPCRRVRRHSRAPGARAPRGTRPGRAAPRPPAPRPTKTTHPLPSALRRRRRGGRPPTRRRCGRRPPARPPARVPPRPPAPSPRRTTSPRRRATARRTRPSTAAPRAAAPPRRRG